jgi:multimeric flavodoxin WrbA
MASESGERIKAIILTPKNTKILPSDGTAQEFFTGVDRIALSGDDDSEEVKAMICKSDYLILGSPTYGHNVSGDMKILMDRLTYWGHLFYLANKPGMAFVSATTNGFLQVGTMLEEFLDALGVVHDETQYNTTTMPFDDEAAHLAAGIIWDSLHRDPSTRVPNERQESVFQAYKMLYSSRNGKDAESRYWEELGMFDCANLKEFFKKITPVNK